MIMDFKCLGVISAFQPGMLLVGVCSIRFPCDTQKPHHILQNRPLHPGFILATLSGCPPEVQAPGYCIHELLVGGVVDGARRAVVKGEHAVLVELDDMRPGAGGLGRERGCEGREGVRVNMPFW